MKYLSLLILLFTGCTMGAINLNVDKSIKTDTQANVSTNKTVDVKTADIKTTNAPVNKSSNVNNSVNNTAINNINNNQKTNNINSTANVNVSNLLLKK